MVSDLQRVGELIEAGRQPEALELLDPILFDRPKDPAALYLLGTILLESEKATLAYHLFKTITDLAPEQFQAWLNFGRAADDLGLRDEAVGHFLKVLDMDRGNVLAMSNLSAVFVKQGKPKLAEKWAKRALRIMPELRSARLNLGFAKLMMKDYSGWEYYEAGLGHVKWRDRKMYAKLRDWDGSPGDRVCVYGEQGLGDQIAMAEPIHQMKKDCRELVLDVNPKLKGLFERSFGVETHGTQFISGPEWADGRGLQACAMSSLQKFYRGAVGRFTGRPYLTADLHRVRAAGALLGGLGPKNAPRIGISWTGGLQETEAAARSTALGTFRPIIEAVEAVWVSLEYKDRSEEIRASGLPIHDFPWMTQTKDYDDTAALVDSLDLVISVPQSIVHLAGGLGKECWVLQAPHPHFIFGVEGETPFYRSVKQYRRAGDEWSGVIDKVAEDLRRRYAL